MIRIRHLGHYLSAAALFVVFGLMALDLTLELFQGPSFATTEGVVTGSRWHTSWSRVGKGYFVDISYAYSVDGRTYRSDHYFGNWNRAVGQLPSREIAAQNPVGKRIVVHYDPKDPVRNYVVLPKEYWRIVLYWCLTVVIPIGIVLMARLNSRKRLRRRWKLRDKLALSAYIVSWIVVFALLGGVAFAVGKTIVLCRRGSPWGFVFAGLMLALVAALVIWRKVARTRAYRKLLSRGVDCGLDVASLREVDALIKQGGKPCRRRPKGLERIAPQVREIAAQYSSIRYKRETLFVNNELNNGFSCKADPDSEYVEIAHLDNETLYVVRRSPTDETVYYLELEWMPAPVPYASDIRHYLALRLQELHSNAAKGKKET